MLRLASALLSILPTERPSGASFPPSIPPAARGCSCFPWHSQPPGSLLVLRGGRRGRGGRGGMQGEELLCPQDRS